MKHQLTQTVQYLYILFLMTQNWNGCENVEVIAIVDGILYIFTDGVLRNW